MFAVGLPSPQNHRALGEISVAPLPVLQYLMVPLLCAVLFGFVCFNEVDYNVDKCV